MNFLLLIFSIIIYASFGVKSLIYISISTLTTFYAAKIMNDKNKKIVLWLTISLNLLILVFFKLISYNGFFGIYNNIIVPMGISYYTFSVIAYLVDVYKGKYEKENKLFNYCLFVFYIPYLIIGPINRYDQVKDKLFSKRKITINNTLNGGLRIVWGLFKKLVIAGRIGIIVSTITSDYQTYYGAYVLYALLLYSIQLYCDFSGGIDVVLGFSKILDIPLSENFNKPYFAENIKEFWHRWHMSLSLWFKDYVYIPLGGNRCSKIRNKLNLIITFVLSGIWHGLNFFLWGLFHGLLVAFNPKKNLTKSKFINRAITYILVSLLWAFFIYPTSMDTLTMVTSIFTNFNILDLFNNILNLGLNYWNIIVLILSVIALIIYDSNSDKIKNYYETCSANKKLVTIFIIGLIVLVFGIYGIGFNSSDFIYSKF